MIRPLPSDLAPTALARELGDRALAASRALATVPPSARVEVLHRLAARLEAATAAIAEANAVDLAAAEAAGLAPALVDRLRLTPSRLAAMTEGVRQVAALPDPVGRVLADRTRPDGLSLRKVSVPLGVIGIVFESRPNVTIDCAALTLRSGNAAILRGGKEAIATNRELARHVAAAVADAGLPADAVQLVPTTDRAVLEALLKLDDRIHAFIPRGGEGLIRFVAEHARVPVIKHYNGICSVYVHAAADAAKAARILVNAKAQRPSACNAAENLWIDRAAAPRLLPGLGRALAGAGVTLRADPEARAILVGAGVPAEPATEADWGTEYLDLTLAVGVVDGLDEAVERIHRHGSQHSDAIVTEDAAVARRFLESVDAAAVFWNASTRFHDGFEFGLGAEIGISTDRLHARGPVGLEELTSTKWIVVGDGHVRA